MTLTNKKRVEESTIAESHSALRNRLAELIGKLLAKHCLRPEKPIAHRKERPSQGFASPRVRDQ